jgi:hypothetical protein
MDLKKYMDTMGDKDGLKPHIVKVSPVSVIHRAKQG